MTPDPKLIAAISRVRALIDLEQSGWEPEAPEYQRYVDALADLAEIEAQAAALARPVAQVVEENEGWTPDMHPAEIARLTRQNAAMEQSVGDVSSRTDALVRGLCAEAEPSLAQPGMVVVPRSWVEQLGNKLASERDEAIDVLLSLIAAAQGDK